MANDQAHKLVDKIPENSTWDDLIREICVSHIIEEGLADSKSGRRKDVREIREKYGLPEWRFIRKKLRKNILTLSILTLPRILLNMPNAQETASHEDLNKLVLSLYLVSYGAWVWSWIHSRSNCWRSLPNYLPYQTRSNRFLAVIHGAMDVLRDKDIR